MRIRETISHEEIIIYGIHLEAKICTKIFATKINHRVHSFLG